MSRLLPADAGIRMARAGLAACLLVVAACSSAKVDGAPAGQGGGSTTPGGAGGAGGAAGTSGPSVSTNQRLQRLLVTPDNDVLLVDRGQSASQAFVVTVVRADGSREDVSSRAQLRADNPQAGTLAGAVLRTSAMTTNQVVFTQIEASYEEGGERVVGRAKLTIVWLRTSGDSQDFFFVLPWKAAAQRKPLDFTTYLQSIDVFFAVDTTSSMGGPISNLRASLRDTIIPAVKKAAVKEAWFGVGAVEDFPVMPYGVATGNPPEIDDQPFILVAPMSADVAAAQAAVDRLLRQDLLPALVSPRGFGGDQPEAHLEALYQIATGEGNVMPGVVNIPAHKGRGRGGVEFREGAQPIVVTVSDVASHTKDEPTDLCKANYAGPVAQVAHTRAQTVGALGAICAKVIGIATMWPANFYAGPTCTPAADMTRLAQATGAFVPPEAWDVPARPAGCPAGQCCTGLGGAAQPPAADGQCPLVFLNDTKGGGLGDQVVSGITQLVRFGSFDVVAVTEGDPLPGGGNTASFIRSVTPRSSTVPAPPPTVKAPAIREGRFSGVYPGTGVRFEIEAANESVPEKSEPQVFHARIKIRAGGCADLDERDVIILVPPSRPIVE